MTFGVRIPVESEDVDSIAKSKFLGLIIPHLIHNHLLESDDDNVLLSSQMLPVVIPNLCTPTGITAPIYVDHHRLVWLTPSRDPDIQSKTIFTESTFDLKQIR